MRFVLRPKARDVLRRLAAGRSAFERPAFDAPTLHARRRIIEGLHDYGYLEPGPRLTADGLAACAPRLPEANAWTDAEHATLERMRAAGCSYGEIAERLGRSVNGVSHKVRELRLTRPRRRWTEREDAIITRDYPHTPANVIAAELGRTTVAIRARARFLGVRGGFAVSRKALHLRTNHPKSIMVEHI